MAFKLYELSAEYQQLIELISNSEGADSDFLALLDDTLESLEGAIEEKLENTAKVIRGFEAEIAGLKTEEERFKKRRQALESKTDRLKEYIFQTMQVTGKEKVKGAHINLRLQYNPPSVKVLDEKVIPAHYLLEQPLKVDGRALLQDLKNGIAVEGVELKREKALRII